MRKEVSSVTTDDRPGGCLNFILWYDDETPAGIRWNIFQLYLNTLYPQERLLGCLYVE